ncbi:Ger(x)C family spore germination protein [Dethiobacter alkaliphilus]|uniref:Germination protein, Ger(X)C family n=1 Tax=Dethiobacter alkaliphilus AHT 1 TaxID=555088 RepID=C0GII8_DETAL|nr:Ger(x)C family spore germination protein [Dethiobacter alkaliphilus]EEG76849.1 germination protein, Ger(x)C family [Dethiobacter alkaliphilus AHT 1]
MNRLLLVVLLTLLLIPGGCGTVQIEDRAFVTAIGLDTVGSGEDLRYLLTVEVYRPGMLQARIQDSPSIIQTVEAENFEKALEWLQARLSRIITLSHLRVLVIGEEAAKEINLREIIDYFERHPEVQMRIKILTVQDGQAMELLKTEPLFEEFISEELIELTQQAGYLPLTHRNPFFKVLQELRVTGGRGLLPRVITTEDGNIAILHGGAVFNDYKLAGWLSSKEVHDANWILGGVQRTSEKVELEDGTYTYSMRRSRINIIPHVEQEQVRFTVKIETEGIVRQQQGRQLDLLEPNNIAKLEKALSSMVVENAQKAIVKSQQDFGIDYLGFGRALRRHNRQFYDQINWEEMFPSVPIDLEVNTKITLTGKTW